MLEQIRINLLKKIITLFIFFIWIRKVCTTKEYINSGFVNNIGTRLTKIVYLYN